MKKSDFLRLVAHHHGFIPFRELYDIYNDDDDIPTGLIELACKPLVGKELHIFVGAKFIKNFNELIKSKPK